MALVRTLRDDRVPQRTPVVELPDLAPAGRAGASLTVEQILGQVSGLRESVDAATVKACSEGAR
ncbi:hypothetical protein ACFW9N_19825 [Streptomyces sp. NPDC059496]|uniref:hypothetical protein n=1 Tax=Streptomyces sp. NPDC059496 TaxID=3346851 RepID=UPI00369EC3FC